MDVSPLRAGFPGHLGPLSNGPQLKLLTHADPSASCAMCHSHVSSDHVVRCILSHALFHEHNQTCIFYMNLNRPINTQAYLLSHLRTKRWNNLTRHLSVVCMNSRCIGPVVSGGTCVGLMYKFLSALLRLMIHITLYMQLSVW